MSADWLIDGTGTAAQQGIRLTIQDGLIRQIAPITAPPDPQGQYFPGCTILPGLIDAHVHLTFGAGPTHADVVRLVTQEPEAALVARGVGNAQAALRSGVTTLRDCGSRGLVSLVVRDAIRAGLVAGPDILASGMPITTTTGHLFYLGLRANSAVDVQAAAEQMVAARVDFLKIVATGGNMTPSSDRFRRQYDMASLRAAVQVGRKAGLHTAAHVLSRCAIPQCVETGVRTIEHCTWRLSEDRYEFDGELARQMVRQEQFAGLTFTAPTWRSIRPEMRQIDPGLMGNLDMRFEQERRMLDAGVKFMLHTDAGVRQTPFAESLAYAIAAAVQELRLSPMEAIVAVTRTPAEALGLPDRGVLAPGKRADLFVVEGNPLTDLAALRRVRAVMRGGIWVA